MLAGDSDFRPGIPGRAGPIDALAMSPSRLGQEQPVGPGPSVASLWPRCADSDGAGAGRFRNGPNRKRPRCHSFVITLRLCRPNRDSADRRELGGFAACPALTSSDEVMPSRANGECRLDSKGIG